MGGQTSSNTNAPVSDPRAIRVCSAAGINIVKARIEEFNKLADGLQHTQGEIMRSQDKKNLIDSSLLALKWTKAACDGIIEIFGALGGPEGKVIAGSYKVGAAVADSGGRAAAGQRVEYVKTASDIGTGLLKTKTGGRNVSDDVKMLDKTSGVMTINGKLVQGAMNNNESDVKKAAFFDLSVEIGHMVLEGLKKETGGKIVEVGKTIADSGIEMATAFEEYREEQKNNEEAIKGMKATMSNQIQRLERKIRNLTALVESCRPDSAEEDRRLP